MGPSRILVVDDDGGTRTLLRRLLTVEGYVVAEADDAKAARDAIDRHTPHLVLLDVVLPGQDGLDLLEELRSTTDVPVILLTAKDEEGDRVVGLKLGADDYVTKPFSAAELAARIETVLRRYNRGTGSPVMCFDGLEIDSGSCEVRLGGRLVDMPAREFELLAFLASAPRQVFGRELLLEKVWGSSADWQDPATVTEHVRRIRRRIEPDPDQPRWIRTVRGMGYRFEP